jgi:hypothetical protein
MLEGAPERGGGDGEEEEARGSLARSESMDYANGLCRFRRAILSALRRCRREKEGEGRGECGLYIGTGWGSKRAGINSD